MYKVLGKQTAGVAWQLSRIGLCHKRDDAPHGVSSMRGCALCAHRAPAESTICALSRRRGGAGAARRERGAPACGPARAGTRCSPASGCGSWTRTRGSPCGIWHGPRQPQSLPFIMRLPRSNHSRTFPARRPSQARRARAHAWPRLLARATRVAAAGRAATAPWVRHSCKQAAGPGAHASRMQAWLPVGCAALRCIPLSKTQRDQPDMPASEHPRVRKHLLRRCSSWRFPDTLRQGNRRAPPPRAEHARAHEADQVAQTAADGGQQRGRAAAAARAQRLAEAVHLHGGQQQHLRARGSLPPERARPPKRTPAAWRCKARLRGCTTHETYHATKASVMVRLFELLVRLRYEECGVQC